MLSWQCPWIPEKVSRNDVETGIRTADLYLGKVQFKRSMLVRLHGPVGVQSPCAYMYLLLLLVLSRSVVLLSVSGFSECFRQKGTGRQTNRRVFRERIDPVVTELD